MLKKLYGADAPVPLDTARMHLRIDGAVEDAYVQILLNAATMALEERTERMVARADYLYTRAAWPLDNIIVIPVNTLRAVTELSYLDSNGNLQVVSAEDYSVIESPYDFEVWLNEGFATPQTKGGADDVQIRFSAGYSSIDNPETAYEACPPTVTMAILFLAAHWYANRESVTSLRNGTAEVPQSFDFLADQLRIYR